MQNFIVPSYKEKGNKMPTVEWLKQEFHYGYRSGDILSQTPDEQRAKEERVIGGSYKYFFIKKVLPFLTESSKVLELGPGGGDWTRALLQSMPEGLVHTCDFQDVRPWLQPESYAGRLQCHQVTDNSFSCVDDNFFDVFFSFGVLVHCNKELIVEILHNALPKIKPGGHAILNYNCWEKLANYGWENGGIPVKFQQLSDDEIWWPRNSVAEMEAMALRAGWAVLEKDMNCFKRDGIIVLQRFIS